MVIFLSHDLILKPGTRLVCHGKRQTEARDWLKSEHKMAKRAFQLLSIAFSLVP